MYEIRGEAVIEGDAAAIWAVVTDVDNWSNWDPHEERARLDGPFAVGTIGFSKPKGAPGTEWTLTEVVPERRWASECPLPGGKLRGCCTFDPVSDGKVRVTKTIWVTGPLVPLFRLYFGRQIRRDMFRTWAALERRIAE